MKARDALISAAIGRRPRQGYLITGPCGVGKKTLAADFAKALLCENPTENGACGACLKCAAFEGGNNADYVTVAPAKKALSVDEARDVRREVSARPYYSDYKVFVIDKAGLMSPAAQNALLKTLEEPPGYAVFILIAESSGQVLETIRSRLAEIAVTPSDLRTCANIVKARLGASIELANFCAGAACGSVGEALRLASDAKFLSVKDKLYEVLNGISSRENDGYLTALDTAKLISEDKEAVDDALLVIAEFFREKLAEGGAVRAVKEVAAARRRIASNANLRLTLEVLMINIMKNFR